MAMESILTAIGKSSVDIDKEFIIRSGFCIMERIPILSDKEFMVWRKK